MQWKQCDKVTERINRTKSRRRYGGVHNGEVWSQNGRGQQVA